MRKWIGTIVVIIIIIIGFTGITLTINENTTFRIKPFLRNMIFETTEQVDS